MLLALRQFLKGNKMKAEIDLLNELAARICPDLNLKFKPSDKPPDKTHSWISSHYSLNVFDSVTFTASEIRKNFAEDNEEFFDQFFKQRVSAMLYRIANAINSQAPIQIDLVS